MSEEALKSTVPPIQADNAWKDVLQVWFPEFMAFFYPELYAQIDWSAGYETLDKELQAITTQSMLGKRFVDKLIKVKSLKGTELWVLLHIEVQGEKETHFEARLFEYYYRLWDRYHIPIATLAILADDNPAWRPNVYRSELWGNEVISFHFSSIKLLDYANQRELLEKTTNPFGLIVLAQLAAIETKESPETRFQVKSSLTRKLYERGLDRDAILNFYKFVDWVLALPKELAIRYNDLVHKIEEEKTVAYITTAERIGMEKGFEQGILKGIQEGMQKGIQEGMQEGMQKGREEGIYQGTLAGEKLILTKQLNRRFNPVAPNYLSKIKHADEDTLLLWSEKILDAKTVEEIFD